MYISVLNNRGFAGLSELADLVIPNCPPFFYNRVQIKTGDTVLLDNYLYGNYENEIHLDLRDLVKDNTYITVPGLIDEDHPTATPELKTMAESARHEEQAVLPLTIIVTVSEEDTTYSFRAYPFDVFPQKISSRHVFTPEIDELQIPEDYLLPLSIFDLSLDLSNNERRTYTILIEQEGQNYDWQVAAVRSIEAAVMTSHLATLPEIISGGYFRPEYGKPFRIGVHYSVGWTKQVWTPYFKMTRKPMEQYAFLSPEGIYYNIPMSGKLWNRPEYDIEVLKTTYSFEQTGAHISDLHEQNSGPLTLKTAIALSKYMISRSVYHYDRDAAIWRKIIIESPSVNIAAKSGAYSLTFQWHYADNNNYE